MSQKVSRLTQDWSREIRLPKFLKTYSRIKGACSQDFHPGQVQIEKPLHTFPTGSTYEGKYDSVGFAGFGVYKFPHGKF